MPDIEEQMMQMYLQMPVGIDSHVKDQYIKTTMNKDKSGIEEKSLYRTKEGDYELIMLFEDKGEVPMETIKEFITSLINKDVLVGRSSGKHLPCFPEFIL